MGIGSISFKKAAGSFISGFGDSFVPGLGTAVSGAVGLGEDELNAQYQAELNEKAANKQFARNLEMWNLNNAYNDPAAQMERLQKAGLNPNLVYGGGNVTGNTSGSTPSYELAGTKYNDTSLQREQLALALKEHQQRITNQAIENDLARQRLVLAERNADRDDALAEARINAYKATFGLTNENNSFRNEYNRLRNEKLRQDLKKRWKSDAFNDASSASEDLVDWALGKVGEHVREYNKKQRQYEWHITGGNPKKNYYTFGRRL